MSELFEENTESESEIIINKFKSGEDDEEFNETLKSLDKSIQSIIDIENVKNGDDHDEFTINVSNNAIEQFKSGADDLIFINLIEKKIEHIQQGPRCTQNV